ncbi:hypothetical protein D3C78_819270 [compost metagenome]
MGAGQRERLAIRLLGLRRPIPGQLAVPQPEPGLGLPAIEPGGLTVAVHRRLAPLLTLAGLFGLADQQPVTVAGQQAAPLLLLGHLGVTQHLLELGDGEGPLVVARVGLTERPHEVGIPGIGGEGTLQLGHRGRAGSRRRQRLLTGAKRRRGPLRLLLGEQGLGLGGLVTAAEGRDEAAQLGDALRPHRHLRDGPQPDLGRLVTAVVAHGHLPQQRHGLLPSSVGQVVTRQPSPHPRLTRVLAVQRLQGLDPLAMKGGDARLQQRVFDRHLQVRWQVLHEQGAIEALGLRQPARTDQQPRLLQLLALRRVGERQIRHALTVEPRVGRYLAELGEQRPALLDLALTQRLTGLGRQQLGVIGIHQGKGIEAVADQIFPPACLPDADLLEQPVDRLYRPLRQAAACQAGEQTGQGQSAWHASLQCGCRVPSGAKR